MVPSEFIVQSRDLSPLGRRNIRVQEELHPDPIILFPFIAFGIWFGWAEQEDEMKSVEPSNIFFIEFATCDF